MSSVATAPRDAFGISETMLNFYNPIIPSGLLYKQNPSQLLRWTFQYVLDFIQNRNRVQIKPRHHTR